MASSAAETLAQALLRHGSDTAFGVPGGGPNLDVVGTLNRHDIRFVLAHSETSSCIMASVYGLLTGRVAAAIVTRGPGAAAAVNGAAQATLDRHPLVLVTDTVPSAAAHRVPHQRLDQRAMLEPACKRSATLSSDLTVTELAELIGAATAEPRGAVHLDYDTTATAADASEATQATGTATDAVLLKAAQQPERLSAARRLLDNAEYPAVIVGLGGPTDPERVGRLRVALAQFGAPVLTTYQAIGSVPTESPQSAGLFTNGASERALLDRADLIVAIGLDVVEPIPAPWRYEVPVISLSSTPTTDPYLPIDVEVLGDPTELAESLFYTGTGTDTGTDRDTDKGTDPDPATGWPAEAGAEHRERVRTALLEGGELPADSPTLGPLDVVQLAAQAAPHDLTVTVDAGAHFLAIMPFWPVSEPHRLLISNGLATMGYAVPAAIAAGLAAPDRPVLCFVGDGGLGMTLAELETIARLELPVTVVVFNDSALSLIQIKQQADHGGDEAVSYRFTDFAALASSFGLDSVAVENKQELTDALGGPWDRPRLIDARIDPTPYRHLIAVTRG